MKRAPHPDLTRQHSALARVLALLLLAFIVHGTTVEAAHKHSNVVERNNSGHSTSISNPETGTGVTNGLTGCGDCLICQLHYDFSTSLTIERDASAPPRTRLDISGTGPIFLTTRLHDTNAGRGPPYIS